MFLTANRGRLFSPDDPANPPGNPPGNPAPAGDPKPLTEADVGRIVNQAVTSQLKRSLGTAITEALGSLDLDTRINDAVSKIKPEPKPEGQQQGDPNAQSKPDPRISKLERELAAAVKGLEAEKNARTEAETRAKRDRAFAEFRSALSGKVRPEAEDAVARLLFKGDGVVQVGDDGQPFMVIRKAPYAGAAEEDAHVSFTDGIEHWLKTPEGKLFAPAPQAARGAQNPGPALGGRRAVATARNGIPTWDTEATTPEEKAERAQATMDAILASRT